ncbi:MAG: hypothetical protein J6P64_08110 [Bacteroidales bacterium]|nr:hypothetical protein [Bacteroidales bacterium]
MVGTVVELYNALLVFSNREETTICHLHKPCDGNPKCITTSAALVVDFDNVEKLLAQGHRSTMPSCDGVTMNDTQTVFCFVEIKGWDQFLTRNIANSDNLLDEDKAKIDQQAAKYNLKGKLEQSIKDCEEITGQTNLFPSIPYAYVIVTDINSDVAALDDFAANLSTLSETASVWTYCDDKMKSLLNSVDITVKKVYAHCRDFDSIVSQIRV